MGFGSYDESEQGKHDISTEIDESESLQTEAHSHNGAIEFENGASNEQLLSKLAQIKQRADEDDEF